ncbi:hypothetical protein ACJ72_08701, partial [Emergomyces africanus]
NVSGTEQKPVPTPRASTTRTTITTTDTASISTTRTNEDTMASAATDPPRTTVAVSSECYSTTNLRRAIEGSVHVVFSREMDRLMRTAETKLADAADALNDVKMHVKAWLKHT